MQVFHCNSWCGLEAERKGIDSAARGLRPSQVFSGTDSGMNPITAGSPGTYSPTHAP